MPALRLQDPYAVDDTPLVTITTGTTEQREVLDYSYTTDILTLTDTFTLTLANPDGRISGTITPGQPVTFHMADPNVNGGAKVLRLTGIVTRARQTSRGGGKLQVQGADRGWFLENSDAPLWLSLSGEHSLATLLEHLLKAWFTTTKRATATTTGDPTAISKTTIVRTSERHLVPGDGLGWGFVNADGSLNVATENDRNKALKQGRAGVERSAVFRAAQGGDFKAFIPPIQIETGTPPGGILQEYARREKKMVNVSADGSLLIWQPNYAKPAEYRLDYHADEARRGRNQVLDADLDDGIDGLFTDVSCITSRVYPPVKAPNREDPNANKIRARFVNTGNLPFYRQKTFTDGDMLDKAMADYRAEQTFKRGIFDSWTYTVTVRGHSQGGLFWEPDSIVAVDDSVNKVHGNFYIQACRFSRTKGDGTLTQLTIKKANLLFV